ncbi:YbfB/YjiJ family MFS transporter [Hydrogenophaga atypica]|uniref:YbfB/YjiJ family MFS transporter n=1 Tax=Hydrogenophaga atypica TaxID=249409 RepID=A0ABW2QLG2_9BURK
MSAAPGRPQPARPITVALAGLCALAVAMGIGRFAFTPLLPMMLHDGVVNLATASWLATANYIGYLMGAVLCALLPTLVAHWPGGATMPAPARLVKLGLAATVLLTLGMAAPWAASWPTLRFLAGVASAFVFVQTSGWCLARLAALGKPTWGGLIYMGPGLGIALSGLAASAMVVDGWAAASGWAVFGVLALLLTAGIWRIFNGPAVTAATQANTVPPATTHGAAECGYFALAYGLSGLGYIVTATFLPVIARQALPGSVWLDLFWPLLGLGVALGAFLSTRLPHHIDRRRLLVGCYAMQALGVLLSVWWPSLVGFALGSLLVGLPFTAISFFGMQEARRLRPAQAAAFMGQLTAVYGLGQIIGPPMVALLLQHSANVGQGFARGLESAAGALVLGAMLLAWLTRRYPLLETPHAPLARSPRA